MELKDFFIKKYPSLSFFTWTMVILVITFIAFYLGYKQNLPTWVLGGILISIPAFLFTEVITASILVFSLDYEEQKIIRRKESIGKILFNSLFLLTVFALFVASIGFLIGAGFGFLLNPII